MRKKIRILKVASVLHRAISQTLTTGDFSGMVVSGVKMSSDLSKANVYILPSSLSKDDYDIHAILNDMNKSAWLIRKLVLRYVNLRFMPELHFKPDLAFNNFICINKILHKHTL